MAPDEIAVEYDAGLVDFPQLDIPGPQIRVDETRRDLPPDRLHRPQIPGEDLFQKQTNSLLVIGSQRAPGSRLLLKGLGHAADPPLLPSFGPAILQTKRAEPGICRLPEPCVGEEGDDSPPATLVELHHGWDESLWAGDAAVCHVHPLHEEEPGLVAGLVVPPGNWPRRVLGDIAVQGPLRGPVAGYEVLGVFPYSFLR